MIRCPKCQHECNDEAQFCGNCAERLKASRDSFVGRCIDDKYFIVRRIAAGGMGEVYLARQKGVGQEVAIKKLHSEYYRDKGIVSRFIDEARSYGRITHPNAVKLHDLLNVNGQLCIVMEYVNGRTLTDYIEKGTVFTTRQITDIGLQLADALWTVHQAGIIHRDLKTENVMLLETAPGRYSVKILDFGIAKMRDKPTDKHTKDGVIVGTPEFMSPEQCYGQGVDQRSDIYSFGILLYVMVCHGVPFENTSPMAVLNMQVHDPMPKMSRPDGGAIPAGLEAIVGHCMMKDPKDRYPSFSEVITDLTRLQEGRGDEIAISRENPSVSGGSASPKRDAEEGTSEHHDRESSEFAFMLDGEDEPLDFSLDHGEAGLDGEKQGDVPAEEREDEQEYSLGELPELDEIEASVARDAMPSHGMARGGSRARAVFLVCLVLLATGVAGYFYVSAGLPSHAEQGFEPRPVITGASTEKTQGSPNVATAASQGSLGRTEAGVGAGTPSDRDGDAPEAKREPVAPSQAATRAVMERGVMRVYLDMAQSLNAAGDLSASSELIGVIASKRSILLPADVERLQGVSDENVRFSEISKQAETARRHENCSKISVLATQIPESAAGFRADLEKRAQKCRAILAAPPTSL